MGQYVPQVRVFFIEFCVGLLWKEEAGAHRIAAGVCQKQTCPHINFRRLTFCDAPTHRRDGESEDYLSSIPFLTSQTLSFVSGWFVCFSSHASPWPPAGKTLRWHLQVTSNFHRVIAQPTPLFRARGRWSSRAPSHFSCIVWIMWKNMFALYNKTTGKRNTNLSCLNGSKYP